MPIRFRCEDCQARIKVPDGTEGRKVKCPRCGKTQLVPAGKPEPQMPTAAAAKVAADHIPVARAKSAGKGGSSKSAVSPSHRPAPVPPPAPPPADERADEEMPLSDPLAALAAAAAGDQSPAPAQPPDRQDPPAPSDSPAQPEPAPEPVNPPPKVETKAKPKLEPEPKTTAAPRSTKEPEPEPETGSELGTASQSVAAASDRPAPELLRESADDSPRLFTAPPAIEPGPDAKPEPEPEPEPDKSVGSEPATDDALAALAAAATPPADREPVSSPSASADDPPATQTSSSPARPTPNGIPLSGSGPARPRPRPQIASTPARPTPATEPPPARPERESPRTIPLSSSPARPRPVARPIPEPRDESISPVPDIAPAAPRVGRAAASVSPARGLSLLLILAWLLRAAAFFMVGISVKVLLMLLDEQFQVGVTLAVVGGCVVLTLITWTVAEIAAAVARMNRQHA